jgi:hypothetical protein
VQRLALLPDAERPALGDRGPGAQVRAGDRRRRAIEAGWRQYVAIHGREPNSVAQRVIEATADGALADWDDRPFYRRPDDEELAWPVSNGVWPEGTPSRVLGEEPEDEHVREESQADDQEARR